MSSDASPERVRYHAVDEPAYRRPYLDIYEELANRTWQSDDGTARRVGRNVAVHLDALFSAIHWDANRLEEPREQGVADDKDRVYARWTHRSLDQLSVDVRALEIDTDELREAVANYVRHHAQLETDYLDWYCADTLAYAQWLRAESRLSPTVIGVTGAMAMRHGPAWRTTAWIWRILWSAVKWGSWLALLVLLGYVLPEGFTLIGIGGAVMLTAAFQAHKWHNQSKVQKLFDEMRGVYDVFRSRALSWEVAWKELERTRKEGAQWPEELRALVERRRHG